MNKLYNQGKTGEEISDKASQMKKNIEIQYKDFASPESVEEISQRNIIRYGDQFGPTVEWYRSKGFDCEQIIEKSLRCDGSIIKFNKYSDK